MPHASVSPCPTVSLYIVYEDRVLMIDHKKMNRWLCPGGHIEEGENPLDALFREMKEETGLKDEDVFVLGNRGSFNEPGVKILPAPSFMDEHYSYDGFNHAANVYFIKAFTHEIELNEKEHRAIKWFTLEEMHEPEYNFPNNIISYAETAVKFVNAMDRP